MMNQARDRAGLHPAAKGGAGFTLIEVIIYIGLFSLIIGGALLAFYQLIEGNSRLQEDIIIHEEANFIIRKVSWALTGAGITGMNADEDILKFDNPDIDEFEFSRDGDQNLYLTRGVDTNVLNSPGIFVESFEADYTNNPELLVTFILNGREFEMKKFIR